MKLLRRTLATGLPLAESYLDRAACVVGALVFSQAPEYFQQYLQRLGGHLDEARRILARFEAAAAVTGKPFATFISDTVANPDPGLAKLGQTMQDTAERVTSLQAAHEALANASLWDRPFAFAAHLQSDIASAALQAFKPAMPVTIEGAVYAAVGIAVALSLWKLTVQLPLKKWGRGHRPPSPQL